jgi:PGF-pre-PGF domain-containing protein/PGF-CTERM protein
VTEASPQVSDALTQAERQTIKRYVGPEQSATIYSPVEYRDDVYLLGYVEDIGSRSVVYVGDDPSRSNIFRSSKWLNQTAEGLFVFKRTDDGLQLVDRNQQDIISAVVDTQAALDLASQQPDGVVDGAAEFHDDLLYSPTATVYFAGEKYGSLKSEEDRYLAALQAMTTAESNYSLIPDRYAVQLRNAGTAAESANTATTIAKQLRTQRFVSLAGESVESAKVRRALQRYSSTLKRIDTDEIGYGVALVDLVLRISEKQVYKETKVEELARMQAYAASNPSVSLSTPLNDAIDELERQNENMRAQTVNTIENFAKENAFDFATSPATKVAAKKFGTYLVSKSSYAASASTWVGSSGAATMLSGAATAAGAIVAGWQIGGLLFNRGGVHTALTKAEYSLRMQDQFGAIQTNIRTEQGTQFTSTGDLTQAAYGRTYAAASHMRRVAVANFYKYDAVALERNIIPAYQTFTTDILGGDGGAEENMNNFYEAADRAFDRAERTKPVAWETIRPLYITNPTSPPPAIPTLEEPANGTDGVATTPTLGWTSDATDAVSYRVYLEAGDASPDVRLTTTQSTTYQAELSPGTTYYWQVVAVGPNGQTTASQTRTFTTRTRDNPALVPGQPTPEPETDGLAPSLSLSWSAADSSNGPVDYEVYLGPSPEPTLYGTSSDSSLSVSGLEQGTTYYWRVIADDGSQRVSSPTWTFTTRSGDAGLQVTNLDYKGEYGDAIAIDGGSPSRLDEAELEYDLETRTGDTSFDLRVVNERGIVIGNDRGEISADGGTSGVGSVALEAEGGAVFREAGPQATTIIINSHASGKTYRQEKIVDVGVNKESADDEFVSLPVDPAVGDTISLDVSHVTEDSGGTPIDTYEWTVLRLGEPYAEVVLEETGENLDAIEFTPREPGEYRITAADGSSDNGYNIDSDEIYVEEAPPAPDMTVRGLSVPETVTQGEEFEATVTMDNDGEMEANYLIRFKLNGAISEVEYSEVDAEETGDTDNADFSLPAGTHTIEAVVIDAHNERHVLTETVTVEENSPPTFDGQPAPAGANGISVDPTLRWAGADPDGDDLTYTVTLEKGDTTPDQTVVRSTDRTSVTPETLEYGTTYYWQVTVTDEHGVSTTSEVYRFTTRPKPNAPPSVSVPDKVTTAVGNQTQIDATTSSDPDGSIVSYEWDLDDDGEFERSGGVLTAVFDRVQNRTLTVRVTDDEGATATGTTSLLVTDMAPPTPRLAVPVQPTPNTTVTFSGADSTDAGRIASYEWDLNGDGEFERTTEAPAVSVQYESPGDRLVRLRVTDTAGNSATVERRVSVVSAATQADVTTTASRQSAENVTFEYTITNTGEQTSELLLKLAPPTTWNVTAHREATETAHWDATATRWRFDSLASGDSVTVAATMNVGAATNKTHLRSYILARQGLIAEQTTEIPNSTHSGPPSQEAALELVAPTAANPVTVDQAGEIVSIQTELTLQGERPPDVASTVNAEHFAVEIGGTQAPITGISAAPAADTATATVDLQVGLPDLEPGATNVTVEIQRPTPCWPTDQQTACPQTIFTDSDTAIDAVNVDTGGNDTPAETVPSNTTLEVTDAGGQPGTTVTVGFTLSSQTKENEVTLATDWNKSAIQLVNRSAETAVWNGSERHWYWETVESNTTVTPSLTFQIPPSTPTGTEYTIATEALTGTEAIATANATVSADPPVSLHGEETVADGGTETTVRFDVEAVVNQSEPVTLDLDVPDALEITGHASDTGTWNASTTAWTWDSLEQQTAASPSLDVAVPNTTAATYSIPGEIISGNESLSTGAATIEIPGKATFTVTLEDVPTNATVGESLTVGYTVENVGTRTATQPIQFVVDGTQQPQRTDLTLSNGDSTTGAFEYTPRSIDGDSIQLTIDTQDDSVTTTVPVANSTAPATPGDEDTESGSSGGAGGGGAGQPGESTSVETDVIDVDNGATARVGEVPGRQTVTINTNETVTGEGVTLETVEIGHRLGSGDYRVEMTDVSDSPPSATPSVDSGTALGYLRIDPIGAESIHRGELSFVVANSELPAGASPEDVVMYHYDDGWEPLQTRHVSSTNGHHEFAAVTDGFSPFAIGTQVTDISVTDVTVVTETLSAGQTAEITATIVNEGVTAGSTNVTLSLGGTSVAEQRLEVAGEETTTITFEQTIHQPGDYTVRVNDVEGGMISAGQPEEQLNTTGEQTANRSETNTTGPDDNPIIVNVPGFGSLVTLIAIIIATLLASRRD